VRNESGRGNDVCLEGGTEALFSCVLVEFNNFSHKFFEDVALGGVGLFVVPVADDGVCIGEEEFFVFSG